MYSKYLPTVFVVISLLLALSTRAQDGNPLEDPDLKAALKQAQEMQKNARELQKNPGSLDTRKKIADMEAAAKAEEARQEQEEKHEKEKLQAALQKQLEAPGPVTLPDWTPATPQFHAAGKPTKKIVDEEVKIIQTGTSSLTPKELADGWEAAAVAANNLNHGRNNIEVNGKLTTIMFLSTRTDPVQEIKLEASREPGGKITQVEISSPLPKPDIGSE
ncbi:MAG: hypothetical protein DME52_10665 [Verrucomicrobia bacterium]|nr:MAG: hypothetical protein DME52_10665 [Verrucomicrobiota bacterium]